MGRNVGDKNEDIISFDTFEEASKYLDNLIVNGGRFMNGGYPFYCTLESNEDAYGRKVGMISFDHSVRWRIDWDEEKGVHFNYEDFRGIGGGPNQRPIKKSIIVKNMTHDQYLKYLDDLNRGLPIIKTEEELKERFPKLSDSKKREVRVKNFMLGKYEDKNAYMYRCRTKSYPDGFDSSLSTYIAENPTYLDGRHKSA